MAAERLDMRRVRDVLRLHFVFGQSPRAIAKSLGCGRTTVRDYLSRANKYNLYKWEDIEGLSDQELEARLGFTIFPKAMWLNAKKVMPDWAKAHEELSRHKKLTLALLWEEYLEANPGGYQYTQFCEHYGRWSKKLSVVMRQAHKAGEKAFVDYCDGPTLVDAETGALIPTELFVGVLGASSYTFAEATLAQTLPNWLSSHVRMYEFFGDVTEITVPDNLKSGVTRPCFYEPVINESYRDLSRHYNTAIIPAHVRKPRHKAKVEAGVLVAQRWILMALRNRVFHTLAELNEAIQELLEKLNRRLMRHLKKSRLELFEELDRPQLKPLPKDRYEFAEWKKAKVNIDYHVEFDEHYYSVPYHHVHEQVDVRATATVVEIYLKGERVTSHLRSSRKGKHTTKPEHMPANHQAMVKWPPSRVLAWAEKIGPSVGLLTEKILASRRHPEQGYRSALGLIRLEKKYGHERLEKSCRRALEIGAHTYRFVADMLKNNMDKTIVDQSKQLSFTVNESNTRGRDQYH
jgi:transposase